MHPFPPPTQLPIWDSPGMVLSLMFLLMLLVMGTIACVLLRDNRKARRYDIGIWIAAGLVLTAIFIWMPTRVPAVDRPHKQLLFLLWGIVAVAGWINWLKQRNQKEPAGSPLGIAAISVIVVALIAVYVGPMSSFEPRSRRRPPCRDNLHHIGLALYNYHEGYNSFPPQFAGETPMSWRVKILPYLDHEDLRRDYVADEAWDSPVNLNVARQVVKEYTCPSVHEEFRSRDGLRFTSYAAAAGEHTLWRGKTAVSLDEITDGTPNTLLVVEACGRQIVWTEPRDMNVAGTPLGINLPGDVEGQSPGLFSSYHTGGAYVLFADGSTRFMSADTDPAVIDALLTADGGDDVGEF